MEDAGPPAAAAAATTTTIGSDWHSQIDPMSRQTMVTQIFKTLKCHLPMSDEGGRSRLQKLAEGYELKFFNEATDKASYKRKIAMLSIYLKNMNQNSHHQAPGLPPQGNDDPAQSSGVPLMSQQQTRQPKTSTYVQDSYLPSLGQSLTVVGQGFTLQNMSGQSTIPHMQLMDTQSAIQSGTQQNPLNIGQQPMQSLCQQSPQYLEGQQQHPQLSMNQQPSLQWTLLTQEPSFPLQQQQQESMGQQPNLHQIQLFCQQNIAVDMQQQHRLSFQSICLNPPLPDNNDIIVPHFSTGKFGNFEFAVSPGLAIHHTLASGADNPRDPLASSYRGVQLSTLENNADREHAMPTGHEMGTDIPFSRNEDSTFSDELHGLLNWESPPSLLSVHGAQDEKCKAVVEGSVFNVDSSPLYAEHEPSLFPGTEIGNEQVEWADLLFRGSGTQMENSADEVLNFESMADAAANQNKPFEMDPQDFRKGFFLSNGTSYWEHLFSNHYEKHNVIWRSYGSGFGYGLGHYVSGYRCFKRTFAYPRTNWIMVVYNLIHGTYIKTNDVVLCHVFQSDSYDPRPKRVPNYSDLDEFNVYSKCDSESKAIARHGKRADVWERFTEIEVLGPDGEVMLTLAICHGCNMAYKTGKRDPKKRKVHSQCHVLTAHKCLSKRHISGNPQGAHH